MQGIATLRVLTDKQQPLAWTVLLGGMPAYRTPLRGVICIDFDRQGTCEHRFVADEGMQFGKGPLRIHPIGFACLWGDPLKPFAVLLAFAACSVWCALEYRSSPLAQ